MTILSISVSYRISVVLYPQSGDLTQRIAQISEIVQFCRFSSL